MFTAISGFLSQFKIYIYAAIVAAAATAYFMHGHAEYDKGYNAAVQKQNDAIVAYQDIVVKKDQENAIALAKLSSDHATEIQTIKDSIPAAQEKIRVITKTIDRPAVCNLADSELQLINEAVNTANGVSKASH